MAGQVDRVVGHEQRRRIDEHEVGQTPGGAHQVAGVFDERGRVRASLSVLPEDPKAMWKGKPYPETVLLRLITADRRPNVKLGASKMGAGLLIGGEANQTYAQVLAEGAETTVKLVSEDGRERVINP